MSTERIEDVDVEVIDFGIEKIKSSLELTDEKIKEWQAKIYAVKSCPTEIGEIKDLTNFHKEVRQARLKLEKKRKQILSPFQNTVKAINSFAKSLKEPLFVIEKKAKSFLDEIETKKKQAKELHEGIIMESLLEAGFKVVNGVAICGEVVEILSDIYKLESEELDSLIRVGVRECEKIRVRKEEDAAIESAKAPIEDVKAETIEPKYITNKTPLPIKPIDVVQKTVVVGSGSTSKLPKDPYSDGFCHARDIILYEFRNLEVKRTRVDWIAFMETINSTMPK